MVYVCIYLLSPTLLVLFKYFAKDNWKPAYILLNAKFICILAVSHLTFWCIHTQYLYSSFFLIIVAQFCAEYKCKNKV